MKTCKGCKQSLRESAFSKARGKYLQARCRSCTNEMNQASYRASPKRRDTARRASKDQRNKLRRFIYDYLNTHPCVVCGYDKVPALQFDHIDPSTKIAAVSFLVSTRRSLPRVKTEIAKCRVLCANCHMMHTAEQQGWYKKERGE